VSFEEGRKEGAREIPHVTALRLESQTGATVAAQTEVVDELGSHPGEQVKMPARLPAPEAKPLCDLGQRQMFAGH